MSQCDVARVSPRTLGEASAMDVDETDPNLWTMGHCGRVDSSPATAPHSSMISE